MLRHKKLSAVVAGIVFLVFIMAVNTTACGRKQKEEQAGEREKEMVTETITEASENQTDRQQPEAPEVWPEPEEEKQLRILEDPEMYSYEELVSDGELLTHLYPDICSWEAIAETADGRKVWLLVIGDPQAGKKVFVNAGIHGREYLTSQLVMKQAVEFLRHLQEGDVYGTASYASLLENTAVYVIPMVNPDGISISQMGMDGILTDQVRQKVEQIAQLDGQAPDGNYLTRWKANGNGVDLNRNFDALWDSYQDPAGHPSSDHYKGTKPGSEPESAALIALTEQESFLRTISYHTQGSVIYWYFAQEGELLEQSKSFAERIAYLTGYMLDDNFQNLDPAGYKDWAILQKEIPSLTIEVGRDTSPVPWEQMEEIWNRNQYVWEEMLLDVSE